MRTLLCWVSVCFLTPLLMAQSTSKADKEFEGAGFMGGTFVGDFESSGTGLKYGAGYQLGLRITQNLHPAWSADLEYSFGNQPLQLTNISPTVSTIPLGQNLHRFTYSASWLALGESHRFRPIARVGTGAGLFYIHRDSKALALALGVPVRDTWKFTMNVGGGFKYVASEQVALTLNVTDYISGIPSYGIPGFAPRGLMHNWQAGLGIAARWNDW